MKRLLSICCLSVVLAAGTARSEEIPPPRANVLDERQIAVEALQANPAPAAPPAANTPAETTIPPKTGRTRSSRSRRGGRRSAPAAPGAGRSPDLRDGQFALSLNDGSQLIGKPVGLATIPLRTSFGEANVPLHVISSMETVAGKGSVKLRFPNGDVVTGTLRARTLRFKTDYGEVNVPATALVRLRSGRSFARSAPTSASRPGRPARSAGRKTAPAPSPFRVHRRADVAPAAPAQQADPLRPR